MLRRVETWVVDYEHGDDEPQHAVLSWVDNEATELPEVGTQLVRLADVESLVRALTKARAIGVRPYTGMVTFSGESKASLRQRGNEMLDVLNDAIYRWTGA